MVGGTRTSRQAGAAGVAPARRRRSTEDGYTLAFLMVVVTVMNIAVASALPAWSAFVQREKEAELIFRGLQYAEAIRVFQKANNRLPITLEELYEKKPRSIRRLYEDPMSESGQWGLLVQSGAGAGAGQQPGAGDGRAQPPQRQERRPNQGVGFPGKTPSPSAEEPAAAPGAAAGNAPRSGGGVVAIPPAKATNSSGFGEPIQRTTGPIVGVYSAAGGKAMRKFMNAESYSQWQFKIDLIPVPNIVGADQPAPRVTSDWIGKPFREDIQVDQGQGNRRQGVPQAGRELGGGSAAGSGLNPSSFRPKNRN